MGGKAAAILTCAGAWEEISPPAEQGQLRSARAAVGGRWVLVPLLLIQQCWRISPHLD